MQKELWMKTLSSLVGLGTVILLCSAALAEEAQTPPEVWGAGNCLLKWSKRDRIMKTAGDGRQREAIWEMSV